MKSNSSLTMNRTASDTIAAVIQVLILFLEDSFISVCVRILINIIGNESGDKSNVTYNWCPQKSRFAKRGPQSSRFTKKRVRKEKSVGTSVLDLSFLLVRSISFYRFSFGSGSTLYKNCGLGSVRVHQC